MKNEKFQLDELKSARSSFRFAKWEKIGNNNIRSYCFKETIGFDVKASFASRP